MPVGVIGSVSHKGPLALALAARVGGDCGIGVDLEYLGASDAALEAKVLTPSERARLAALRRRPQIMEPRS
jgi:4'-phosphopantetheinyl transferase EntD